MNGLSNVNAKKGYIVINGLSNANAKKGFTNAACLSWHSILEAVVHLITSLSVI